ncbi:hypothetical protein IFM89_020792 [Coptis chinensis]|uniref:aspartyl aminopeptidase n=1 Tax=Coptis chinensis TaxID=261450 RepID=A0A835HWZ9_9MAGN|nr:hypothetical protein IFM89_020792 [Coptis chinensis]
MAAMHSFHFLKPYSYFPITPSSLSPKYPYYFPQIPLRKFSSSTPLIFCSKSEPILQDSKESSASIVGDLLDYLNESWTHFHATAEAKRQLIAAGFHLLKENDAWDLKPAKGDTFTGNMSSLVAFAIGQKYKAGSGFHVIAAHTDSPCLKLKLKFCEVELLTLTYGGGLWHTWSDRDLSVAGRVILKASDGSFIHKLVKVKRPLLRVPTLAIHLDRFCQMNWVAALMRSRVSIIVLLKALVGSCEFHGDLASEHAIRMVALFDNEEVGSIRYKGAGAPTMFQAMRRIVDCLSQEYVRENAFERAIRQSMRYAARVGFYLCLASIRVGAAGSDDILLKRFSVQRYISNYTRGFNRIYDIGIKRVCRSLASTMVLSLLPVPVTTLDLAWKLEPYTLLLYL